jgi:hypothetical protein
VIWLSWRLSRVQAAAIFAAVAALAVALAATGPHLSDLHAAHERDFLALVEGLDVWLYRAGIALAYLAPAVIGGFWGAPLVARELETGTYRLAWTQSVGRRRWLATRMGLGVLGALAAAGLLTLAVTWWSAPIDASIARGQSAGAFFDPRISPAIFGARGLVPVGYVAFAFAAGVAIGLVLRRSVAAIAVTMAVVVAVQIVVPNLVREHLATPVQITTAIVAGDMGLMIDRSHRGPVRVEVIPENRPADWILSADIVDARGRALSKLPAWVADCAPAPPTAAPVGGGVRTKAPGPRMQDCSSRLTHAGYHERITIQPASAFWTLQWRETVLLLGLALLLTAFCFRRIERV